MKRLLSVLLALLTVFSLASCAVTKRAASSAEDGTSEEHASADLAWLEARLGTLPDGLTVTSGEDCAVDMSAFEDDGYLIRTVGDETVIAAKGEAGLDLAVRKYAKLCENGRADEIDIAYHEGYRIEKLTVFGHDVSEYKIVIPADVHESVKFAAEELQRLLAQACGAELDVVSGKYDGLCFEFRVADPADESFTAEESFAYFNEGENIVFVGAYAFGCPTAVYHYLQDEMGWTDLVYGDSVLCESDHTDLGECSAKKNPVFAYTLTCNHTENSIPQNNYLTTFISDRALPDKNRIGQALFTGRDYGGYVRHANHGMQSNQWGNYVYVEWYHVCYSDESILENVTADIYEYIEDQLASGKQIGIDLHYIDLATGDNLNFCHCKKCNATIKEENNANAGPIVRFMNTVSEELDADFPGLKYLQFAYHGSNVPPKTAPNDLVYFTYCNDGGCYKHPMDAGMCQGSSFDFAGVLGASARFNNTDYAKWLRGWCELSPNIYVWYYGMSSIQMGLFTMRLYEDLSFFRELGVKGIYFYHAWNGFGLQRIDNRLFMKFNWESDMTGDEFWDWYDRFLETEFGDGWMYMKDYVGMWQKSQLMSDECVNDWSYASCCETDAYDNAWYAEHFDEMTEDIDNAIKYAQSAVQEIHCMLIGFTNIYKGCFSSYFAAYEANDDARLAELNALWEKMLDFSWRCGVEPGSMRTVGAGDKPYNLNLEDEAWKRWKGSRKKLVPDGIVEREAPEKYR